MNNGDMPAMPNDVGPQEALELDGFKNGVMVKRLVEFNYGLTKREHFASMAMSGLCTSQDESGEWRGDPATAATLSVEYADALLKALENK